MHRFMCFSFLNGQKDYSCAIQKDILVHGRLYVSQNYLCFHANIIVYETRFVLRWKDVTSISEWKWFRKIKGSNFWMSKRFWWNFISSVDEKMEKVLVKAYKYYQFFVQNFKKDRKIENSVITIFQFWKSSHKSPEIICKFPSKSFLTNISFFPSNSIYPSPRQRKSSKSDSKCDSRHHRVWKVLSYIIHLARQSLHDSFPSVAECTDG